MSFYDIENISWLNRYDRLSFVLVAPMFIAATIYMTPVFLVGWIARKVCKP